MIPNRSRRVFLTSLGTAALVGLAGCADSVVSGHGATDIILHNAATSERDVTVTVTDQRDATSKIDSNVALGPNTSHTFNNRVMMNGDYEVHVAFTENSVHGSPYTETHEWKNANQPLHIILNDQIVFAVQVS